MLRIGSLVISIVGVGLLMAPSSANAQDGIPDLLGDWTMTETSADGATTTTEWEVYVHDPAEGLFFARIGEYDDEVALMTGKIKGDKASLSIDLRDDPNRWDLLTGTISTAPDLTIAGVSEQRYGAKTGDFFVTSGTFEMRRTDDGVSAPAASPAGDSETVAADTELIAADAEDLRGVWTWAAFDEDGEAFPVYELIATVHDPRTGVVAAHLLDEEDRLVSTMAGLIDGEHLTTRMTFVTNEGGWSDFEGTRVPGADLRYAGTYEISTTGETGTFEATYVGPVVETDADGTDVSSGTDAIEQSATTTVACDDTRLDAATTALSGPTPYTAMTSLQRYEGASDELALALLVEEHVADPVTWERTTNIPGEAGWSVFETRRLGEEVWTRLDGGDWSVEAPEAGVLSTPWAFNILIEELMPGGQAADPAVIWNQVGEQCIVSQLFRVEDGGRGKGRSSRLTFVGDEALPRTIEWELVRPPTGRIKGKATRPGPIESILITIESGAVEPIEAPPARE